MTVVKYTEEDAEMMATEYLACNTPEERKECVEILMQKLNKPKSSIIMKLVKLKVYKSALRVSKVTKGEAKTKVQLVHELEDQCGFERGRLDTMEKTNKLVILDMINYAKKCN